MAKALVDAVQITGDDTDVFNGRIPVPIWAKWADFWLVAPDSDWLHSITVDGIEYARTSGPNSTGADNVQGPLFDEGKGYSSAPVQFASVLQVNVDVVTAGVGTMAVRYRP